MMRANPRTAPTEMSAVHSAEATEPPGGCSAWAAFTVLCSGMFMAILDVQIVATSLPTIEAALSMSQSQTSWIQTAYLIAEVIAIPLTGLLIRMLTLRWLFVGALVLFTVASLGCAISESFVTLICWRVFQGFAGGVLIPAVFAAVFLLFPARRHDVAMGVAGMLAVIAPTFGPIVGGWITTSFSWHMLFAINLAPGIAAIGLGVLLLPPDRTQPKLLRELDLASLVFIGIALAAFEIGLKEAPERGWTSFVVVELLVLSAGMLLAFVRRSLRVTSPIVELRTLRDFNFSIGCILSFVCGLGLYGSVYLMPAFLGFVRGHDALEIGQIMLVTGIAQLVITPLAVLLQGKVDVRLLACLGFVGFAIGAAMSIGQSPRTDYDGMFWPQIIRGASIMLCLLAPTQLALGHLASIKIPDASALFNLMRNLGGAIGLALIDTVIYGRAPALAESLKSRLLAGDAKAFEFVGIPARYITTPLTTLSPNVQASLKGMVGRAATTVAMDEAWALMAMLTLGATAICAVCSLTPLLASGRARTIGVSSSRAASESDL
jgi:DHA2 family multidrug resistance protein